MDVEALAFGADSEVPSSSSSVKEAMESLSSSSSLISAATRDFLVSSSRAGSTAALLLTAGAFAGAGAGAVAAALEPKLTRAEIDVLGSSFLPCRPILKNRLGDPPETTFFPVDSGELASTAVSASPNSPRSTIHRANCRSVVASSRLNTTVFF